MIILVERSTACLSLFGYKKWFSLPQHCTDTDTDTDANGDYSLLNSFLDRNTG